MPTPPLYDYYADASARIYTLAQAVAQALPTYTGDPAVAVYKTMHESDAPNAVALFGSPVDLETEAFATGLSSAFRFTVRVYVRTQNADEQTARARASRITCLLCETVNADPRLDNAVDRCDAQVSEWSVGVDNQHINTVLVCIDFRCYVVSRNGEIVAEIIGGINERQN